MRNTKFDVEASLHRNFNTQALKLPPKFEPENVPSRITTRNRLTMEIQNTFKFKDLQRTELQTRLNLKIYNEELRLLTKIGQVVRLESYIFH